MRCCASSCETCSDRITGRCRKGRRRTRSKFRRTISRPPFVPFRRPRGATAPRRRRGFSSTSTSSCTTFPPHSWTRAASPAPRTCRTVRTPRTCTRTACTCSRERIRTARRGTTRSCACCRGGTGRSASAPRRDAAARSKRTSASGKPTSSSRSGTSWDHEPAGAARASPILQARTGITRTAMARHTIRSPAASPASSSSKGMSTMRSTAR